MWTLIIEQWCPKVITVMPIFMILNMHPNTFPRHFNFIS